MALTFHSPQSAVTVGLEGKAEILGKAAVATGTHTKGTIGT